MLLEKHTHSFQNNDYIILNDNTLDMTKYRDGTIVFDNPLWSTYNFKVTKDKWI